MKTFFRILSLLIFVFLVSCSNIEKTYKNNLSKGISNNKINIFENNDGNLAFKIEENGKSFTYEAKLFDENKDFITFSFIEISKNLSMNNLKEIKVFSNDNWEKIQTEIFNELIPKNSNEGILFLINFFEFVGYRDSEGGIVFKSLEEAPKNIEIIEKFDDKKFNDFTLNKVEEFCKNETGNVIFLTSDIEKSQMPYVYYNTKSKKLVSIYNSYEGGENHQSISYLLVRNIAGLINNPVTVGGRLIFYIYNSAAVLTTQGVKVSKESHNLIKSEEIMDTESFLKKISKKVSKKPYKGSLEFLIDGEDFFHDFIESIKNAEKQILIRTYIFDNDDYAVKIADLLKEKSNEVEVKVLMDEIGSMTAAITNPATPMPLGFNPPKRIDKYLEKNSKVKTRTAKNPWFTVDHNKVMLFDDKYAYMGGMNIGKEYRYEWHDMMIKTEGPIVGVLREDFEEAWAHAGVLGDLSYFGKMITRDETYKFESNKRYIDILPIYTKTGKTEILDVTLQAIKDSKKEIIIESAYFSDDKILKELVKAKNRGVDVTIILPYWGNHNIMNAGNIAKANILIKSGIKVYLYPKMNHVKASLFDGFAMVGTANYDKFSMRVNQEINFCFWDKETVETLKKSLFEKDIDKSMRLTGEFQLNFEDYIWEKIANQL